MKQKILSLLVLLLTAATGAWAQGPEEVINITNGCVGEHYQVTGGGTGASWRTIGGSDNLTITVESLNGEIIDNLRLEVYFPDSKWAGNSIASTSGNVSGDVGSYQDLVVTGINATSVTLSRTGGGDAGGSVSFSKITINEGIVPAPDIEVTINEAKTEATFAMPAYDATAEYELVRDMEIDVNAVIANRIRIKKDGTTYVPVTATELMPVIIDELDEQNPVIMVLYNETDKTGDYTVKLQKKVEGETPSWADAEALSVGTFRYVITGAGLYDGEITTVEFQLFEGFEVEVAAGEYATFYKDENLTLDAEETEAQLYTITSVGTETATATELTVAKANMPILVKNNGQEKKVILLIPTVDDADEVTAAKEFVGTLVATTIPASTSEVNNYAFNGKQFVWVKNAIEVGANKAWLSILTGAQSAPVLNLVFEGDVTGISGVANSQQPTANSYYDLNGRKLQNKPTKKGVYLFNGRKVVVK